MQEMIFKSGVFLFPAEQIDQKDYLSFCQHLNYMVFFIAGKDITSKEDFFMSLSATLKFPDYFGHNWDAFEECLRDLSWIPAKGYILLFDMLETFAESYPSDYEILQSILHSVSEEWYKEAVLFQTIILTKG